MEKKRKICPIIGVNLDSPYFWILDQTNDKILVEVVQKLGRNWATPNWIELCPNWVEIE